MGENARDEKNCRQDWNVIEEGSPNLHGTEIFARHIAQSLIRKQLF